MATSQQQLAFAVRAVNEASATLKQVQKDITDTGASAEKATKHTGTFGSSLSSVSKIASGFVVGSLLTAAPGMLRLAAERSRDLELQAVKTSTVFGSELANVEKWAASSARAMGLTRAEAVGLAANFADLLIPMGFSREQARLMSTDVIGLSGALAEWSGGRLKAAEVSEVLAKAMLGERDGLKALGIAISEEDVKQRLVKNGTEKLTGALLEQAKAVATRQLIFEKSTDAQTAFANGANSAARQQAQATADMAESWDRMSRALGPAIAKLTPIVVKAVEAFTMLPAPLMAVGLAAAALLPILPGLAAGFTLLLGPIGLVVAAIAAAIAIGVLLYRNWDMVKAKADELGFGGLITAISAVANGFKIAWEWVSKYGEAIASLPMTDSKGGQTTVGKTALGAFGNAAFGGIPGAFQSASRIADLISGRRAMGGLVQAGKMYLVGERGPEPFIPETDGTILPNDMGGIRFDDNRVDVRGVEDRRQPPVTINVTLGSFIGDAAALQRAVLEALHQAMQRGSLGLN